MPPISAICRTKPSTLASAPKPNRLASPAPIRPPSRIERQPPKREANPPAGAATLGLPACGVMDFSIGAALGAVLVLGGAVYVREPRLPKLPPPPGRASAVLASIASEAIAAMAMTASLERLRDTIETSAGGDDGFCCPICKHSAPTVQPVAARDGGAHGPTAPT